THVLQKRLGVFPLALLLLELPGLVDEELPVVRERDAVALERPRRRAFEVDAGRVEAGAVAGALELAVRLEPVRGAAEMGAGGRQREEAGGVAHDPHAE